MLTCRTEINCCLYVLCCHCEPVRTPVCGLVRNDRRFETCVVNNNLSHLWMVECFFAGFEEKQLRLGDGFAIIYAIVWRSIATERKEGGSRL